MGLVVQQSHRLEPRPRLLPRRRCQSAQAAGQHGSAAEHHFVTGAAQSVRRTTGCISTARACRAARRASCEWHAHELWQCHCDGVGRRLSRAEHQAVHPRGRKFAQTLGRTLYFTVHELVSTERHICRHPACGSSQATCLQLLLALPLRCRPAGVGFCGLRSRWLRSDCAWSALRGTACDMRPSPGHTLRGTARLFARVGSTA